MRSWNSSNIILVYVIYFVNVYHKTRRIKWDYYQNY
nr:MAG TPA: hypothetical protein [Caudoviricetes sp.]